MLKEKKALSPDHQLENPRPSMLLDKCTLYTYSVHSLHVYCTSVDLNSSGSPDVRPTPGLTSNTQVICMCVRVYTSTHPPTTLTPSKNRKIYKTGETPISIPAKVSICCVVITEHIHNSRHRKETAASERSFGTDVIVLAVRFLESTASDRVLYSHPCTILRFLWLNK